MPVSRSFFESDFHDAQFMAALLSVLGLEEVEFTGGWLSYFHNAAEGVLIVAAAL